MTCEPSNSQLAKTRYLLVDDHDAFRQMLASFLPGSNREVAEAADGEEALKLYDAHRADWVLMDVEMPVLDGISATRQLVSHHPDARVIILTQYESPEIERAALESGAVGFLHKAELPLLPELLRSLGEAENTPPNPPGPKPAR